MPDEMELLIMTVEKLKHQIREVLNGIIKLHIDILVMEADVLQLIDHIKEINADLSEVNRLDKLIKSLKQHFNGPIVYHEWPYPPLCYPATKTNNSTGDSYNADDNQNLNGDIDEADIAIQMQFNNENT